MNLMIMLGQEWGVNMNKHEALEFIENRLIDVDMEMLRDDELTDDSPSLTTKWLLLEAQARILDGQEPSAVMRNVLEL